MKNFILAIVALAGLSGFASAQCPGGQCRVNPAPSVLPNLRAAAHGGPVLAHPVLPNLRAAVARPFAPLAWHWHSRPHFFGHRPFCHRCR